MRGNALRGDGTRLYDGGNTDIVQRDSGYLAVPPISAVAGHRTGDQPMPEVERGCGQTRKVGAYANQCLNLTQLERPMEESQDSEPDLRNSAVRDYRGASGNAAKVELCTRLATKRARTVTLHLQAGAREFYPNILKRMGYREWKLYCQGLEFCHSVRCQSRLTEGGCMLRQTNLLKSRYVAYSET